MVPTGPVMGRVGEHATDPLTVVVAPFEGEGDNAVAWPDRDGSISIRYEAAQGHAVRVDGAPGSVELDVTGDAPVALSLGSRSGTDGVRG